MIFYCKIVSDNMMIFISSMNHRMCFTKFTFLQLLILMIFSPPMFANNDDLQQGSTYDINLKQRCQQVKYFLILSNTNFSMKLTYLLPS